MLFRGSALYSLHCLAPTIVANVKLLWDANGVPRRCAVTASDPNSASTSKLLAIITQIIKMLQGTSAL